MPSVVFLEAEPWEEEFLMARCPPSWQARSHPDEADRIAPEQIADAEILSVSGRFDEDKLRAVVRHHVLLKRDDVIITPHIAFNSREAVERILTTTIENIAGFLEGASRNRVA